jgi:GT2 family glycosyltransferase
LTTETGGAIELSIIIVSYNTRELTLACLRSVYAHHPSVPFELVVLDNGSSDGSSEAIAAEFPQAKLLADKQNHGFATGNNIAARTARGRRLLLLNPDTVVLEGSLDGLWQFAERLPDRGIWGGRTLFEDHSLNPTSCWGRMTPWTLLCSAAGLTWLFPNSPIFSRERYGGWARDCEREVDVVTGCFLLIDRALWKRLAGFDPLFFMYAEEADLCLRARNLGARPTFTPEAEIIHLGGRSERSPVEKSIKLARGRVTLIRKHWPPVQRAVGLSLYVLWAFSRRLGARIQWRRRGASSSRENGAAIWQRRSEWLKGY